MKKQTLWVTWGALLHDVGKVIFRASGEKRSHSELGAEWLRGVLPEGDAAKVIAACARYHHAQELRSASLQPDALAYIVYAADNIAAAADRREEEESQRFGFDRFLPLGPVFSHMNKGRTGSAVPLKPLDDKLQTPVSPADAGVTASAYEALLLGLKDSLRGLPEVAEAWTNSLLVALECWLSAVPSSTCISESPDISLYDHMKITAAAAACMSEYLLNRGVTDYRGTLMKNEKAFRAEQAFLLYSADFSGIQKFIYTVSTANALRSLRSRSFFLEMAMEHYIDELLEACGLSRANLLYSGGGHCYLLLPNTETVTETVKRWNTQFNDWLIHEFGCALYLADGFTPCSADDLTNTPPEKAPYRAMFQRVSQAVSSRKMHRYSAAQIRKMNNAAEEARDGRECRICGRVDHLVPSEEGTLLCSWCRRFVQLSNMVMKKSVLLVSTQEKELSFPLPSEAHGEVYLSFTDEVEARKLLQDAERILRVYTINKSCSGLRYSTRLYVGNYAASSQMTELAEQSKGIKRLGICRMDVDNLGQAFVAGFEQTGATSLAERMRYVTISRTAAFSRQMSLFFKYWINSILDGRSMDRDSLKVTIVYSGGDDVFLVGAWSEAFEAARRIRHAFEMYTCGTLTISCGIGMVRPHHPIRLAAAQAASLEDASKAHPGKDAITLFDTDAGYTHSWQAYEQSVAGEKLNLLRKFFTDGQQQERGKAFLYRLVELLREARTEGKLPLARCAYLLARLEPPKESTTYAYYENFSRRFYQWALVEKEREELILAILIFVYEIRQEAQDDAV